MMPEVQNKKEYIERGALIIKTSRAILVRGNYTDVYEDLNDMVFDACGTNLDDPLHVVLFERESLSVDDARDIKEAASKVSRTAQTMHVVVIAAQTITREAQNSLLKVLEEPIETVAIIVVTPHPERLLPTLVSRLANVSINLNQAVKTIGTTHALAYVNDFIVASIPDRLVIVQNILKEVEKGDMLKEHIAQFCAEIKKSFEYNKGETTSHAQYIAAVKALEPIHSYLLDQSSSVKLLLEHLALSLPHKSVQ